MQNNGHIINASQITSYEYVPSDITIGPYGLNASGGIVYPLLPNQNMQIRQPIQPIAPNQQYVGQIPYQQQQYPYFQQQQQVTYNPTAIQQVQPVYSKYPQMITCAYCQRQVQTQVNYEVGTGAYAVGGLLAAVGLWLGCCLVPFFVKDCKDAVHFCPSCLGKIGKKRFLFD